MIFVCTCMYAWCCGQGKQGSAVRLVLSQGAAAAGSTEQQGPWDSQQVRQRTFHAGALDVSSAVYSVCCIGGAFALASAAAATASGRVIASGAFSGVDGLSSGPAQAGRRRRSGASFVLG